jgi:hypothetical protein
VKRLLRRLLIALLGAAGALAALFITLVWWRTWNPAFDYGPYTGVPHPTPDVKPLQEFPVWAGRRLVVYPRADGDLAPVVALKQDGARVVWSIEARGKDGCQVNSLRFDSYSTLPWIWPRVVGLVDWNCGGREQTVWKLSRDGTLMEYWYSW